MPQELDRVALFLVVDQWTIEIRGDLQIAQIVFPHELRVFVTAKRLDLPASAAVIGLHCGQSLQRECLSSQVWTRTLLVHACRIPTWTGQSSPHPDAFNRLDFVHTAFGLNILVHQFVGGLRKGERAKKRQHYKRDYANTHAKTLLKNCAMRRERRNCTRSGRRSQHSVIKLNKNPRICLGFDRRLGVRLCLQTPRYDTSLCAKVSFWC